MNIKPINTIDRLSNHLEKFSDNKISILKVNYKIVEGREENE